MPKDTPKKKKGRTSFTIFVCFCIALFVFIIAQNPNRSAQYVASQLADPTIVPNGYVDPNVTPKPTKKPRPTPAPTPEPTPMPTPNETYYTYSKYDTPVYEIADYTGTVMGWIPKADPINVIDSNNGYARVLYGNKIGYCLRADFVEGEAPPAPPAPNPDNDTPLMHQDPNYTGYVEYGYYYHEYAEGRNTELVDIRLIIPSVTTNLVLGEKENFMGEMLCKRAIPVMQRDTAIKLKKAANLFARDGYTIKIYDAYRPKSVQYTIYDKIQNSMFVENPYIGVSDHSRGAAIDIVLVDKNGEELEFPTEVYDFSSNANKNNSDKWTDEQRHNVEYMTRIMEQCGFKSNLAEWWHFSDTNADKYEALDLKMKKIPRYKKDAAIKLIGQVN